MRVEVGEVGWRDSDGVPLVISLMLARKEVVRGLATAGGY